MTVYRELPDMMHLHHCHVCTSEFECEAEPCYTSVCVKGEDEGCPVCADRPAESGLALERTRDGLAEG